MSTAAPTAAPARKNRARLAWYHAAAVAALILGLVYYWFGVADRYLVFLYFHDMGRAAFDTSPFGFVTASRYWMAGLTAGGAVVVLYSGANWLLGRLQADYDPPEWWRVWLLAAVPVAVGVPAITMTVNDPTLPLFHALRVTAATLLALGPALAPGRMAARRPGALLLLAADGWGLALLLVSLVGFASLRSGRAGPRDWLVRVLIVVGVGLAWLGVVSVYRVWRRTELPGGAVLFGAGAAMAYLFLPLVHHLAFTGGYYYIASSDNYFSRGPGVQLGVWLTVGALAAAVSRLRLCLVARRQPRGGGPG